MDYKARLTLDTSQHDDAINKSAKQVNEYDAKVKQTGTDVRKLVAEERKAARERAIANKHYQEMARSVGDFSKGLTGGIGILGKFSGALAIGATAAKVVSDAFMSTESNIDAWGIKVSQAKAAYDVFVTSLNNGNWSNFFTNLSEAIRGAKELYEKLDDLGSYKASNKAVLALQRATIADLKRRKANGEKDINGKDIDDVIKAAEDRLEEIRRGAVKMGKEAGKDYMKKTLEKYNSSLSGVSDSISQQYIEGGSEYLEMQKRIRAGYESIMNDTEDVVDEFGNVITSSTIFNPDKLSEAFRRQYDIAVAVTEKESELEKGISMYADAVDEETNISQELYRADKTLNSGTTKATDATENLTDEEKELKSAMERFEKSIKSAQMKMSALKVWSGITNMSEIDVLEESIRINSEEINSYRVKLEKLKEIQGETATLSEEENKQLKQLIETQKGYRRKLSKLKVEEEERRTSNDYSGLNQRLPKLNDVVNQTYLKYINDLQNTDLFNIWENGKVHVDAKRDEAELIEKYYNEIYKYIQNIEESRKDLQYYLDDYLKSNPTKVNPGTELAKRFEEIGGDFELDKKRYEEANGTITDKVRYAFNYWFEHVDEYKDKLDKAILDAYLEAFKKGIDPKEFIKALDFGDITNIYDKLDTGVALGSTLKGKGVDFDYQDEKLKEFIETIKSGLDGDEEAQKFVDAFANGLRQYHIGQYIESIVGKEYKEAISKSINEQLKEINWKKYDLTKEQVSVWQNGSNAIRSFAGAWESMQDTLNDEDASGLDKFFAIQDVINSTIDSVFSLIDGYKQLQEIQKSFSTIAKQENAIKEEQNALTKESTILKATETTTNNIEAASAGKAAIAEGTKKAVSTSSHWIEAIAAISAVIAAITAALAISGSFSQGGIVPKFADGGIFSGNRTVGDYNIARVNSGEMILNGSQQSKLFQLLDGAGGFTNNQPSGEVTFRIEGNTLVGVLNNYNKRKSKIV